MRARLTGEVALAVAGLRKSYGSVRAVRDVSFTVGHGEIVALLGPNGSGKTTTLEILEGFRTRDAGAAQVLGLDPASRSSSRELRERTGLVLQDIAVEPYLTVRETIARQVGYYRAPRRVPAGAVIAEGTPASLGGRDAGRSRIAFALPDGHTASDLPLPALVSDGAAVLETCTPTEALRVLTDWAWRRGIELAGLTVSRPSLEDIYLRLTTDGALDGAMENRAMERSTR